MEEAIQKKVADSLDSQEIKLEIQMLLDEGRKKLTEEVAAELEREKQTAQIEAQRKEASSYVCTFEYQALYLLECIQISLVWTWCILKNTLIAK